MACNSCSSGGCGTTTEPANGNNIVKPQGGCSKGCSKQNSYDWLAMTGYPVAPASFPFVEIKFKGGRKDYYYNPELELYNGDAVVVSSTSGWHIGHVAMQGELVRIQMKRKGVKQETAEQQVVLRHATEADLNKGTESRNREMGALFRTRQIVMDHKLNMKVSDVEFQADGTRATFYYSADERIDFRELIKDMATEFKLKVDMRQINLRQEAGRIGGIGICGRELCCSTWLTDFKTVTTSAARYQNLSVNPVKLSGQCGRLKCCLNYELDTYMAAIKEMPHVEKALQTERGDAYLQKTDIFKRLMWFGYKNDSNWIALEPERVLEIQSLNKQGKKAIALSKEDERKIIAIQEDDGPINEDLLAMDAKFKERDKERRGFVKTKNKTREQVKHQRPAGRGSNPQAATSADAGAQVVKPNPQQQQQRNRPERQHARPRPEGSGGAQGPQQEQQRNRPERQHARPRPEGSGPAQDPQQQQQRNRPERQHARPRPEGSGGTPEMKKMGPPPPKPQPKQQQGNAGNPAARPAQANNPQAGNPQPRPSGQNPEGQTPRDGGRNNRWQRNRKPGNKPDGPTAS